jgi:sec-independent protein translocase protein TatC
MEHLGELKRRLVWSALVGVGFTILAIVFYRPIFEVLARPAGDALNPLVGGKFVFQDVTELWSTIAKVGVIAGISVSLPFFLYQIIAFVSPALNPRERNWLRLLIPAALVSFAAGVAFGYFAILPPAIRFLLSFGSDIAEPLIRISSYVSLIIMLMFWMGIIFEIPLVMYFLARIGILKPSWVSKQRRWAIMAAVVLGAIITPTPDPVNQALVAGPIIAMYEIGFWLSRFAQWQRARSERKRAAAGAT